ncbi:MAG: DUF3501 family protein [Chloroflexota bacterium]|nr:MAG: DUF3501 family protein [Chloroflexota bacterium]
MKRIRVEDIKLPAEYEGTREDMRRAVADVRRYHRIQVGDLLSFAFENRATVLFQIQELIRAENITDAERIKHEIQSYSRLLPSEDELIATMLIQFRDRDEMADSLSKVAGIQESVCIVMGRRRVRATTEPGPSRNDRATQAHYLRFRFPPVELDTFLDSERDAYLVVDHPNYYASAKIDGETRASLIKDLTD